MPVAKLRPPSTSMKIRNPLRAQRAVRREHGGKDAWVPRALSLSVRHGAPLYRTMARKTPRKAVRRAARKAPRRTAQGLRKARTGTAAKVKEPAQRATADRKAAAGAVPQWTTAEIEEAFRRFQAANAEPKGELQHVNPFTLLVAVVLSAQATDAGVNKATPALFAAADTPAKMAALGEARVQDLIKTIGLFRTKAKNVVALSQKLVAEHGGEVPRSREALEALPGVGRKTANVVLNIAFGEPTIAVDTHIFRVGNRTGLAPGKTPFEVEMKLERGGAGEIQAARPPLADPARALRLRRAPAAVRNVHHRRSVQVAGQDGQRLDSVIASRRRSNPGRLGQPKWLGCFVADAPRNDSLVSLAPSSAVT